MVATTQVDLVTTLPKGKVRLFQGHWQLGGYVFLCTLCRMHSKLLMRKVCGVLLSCSNLSYHCIALQFAFISFSHHPPLSPPLPFLHPSFHLSLLTPLPLSTSPSFHLSLFPPLPLSTSPFLHLSLFPPLPSYTSPSLHLSLLTPLPPYTSPSLHLSLLTPLPPYTSPPSLHLSLLTPLPPYTSPSLHLSLLTPLPPYTSPPSLHLSLLTPLPPSTSPSLHLSSHPFPHLSPLLVLFLPPLWSQGKYYVWPRQMN